jgi:hypothetical protein
LGESAEEVRWCRAWAQGRHELADLRLGATGGAIQDLAQTSFLEDVTKLHKCGQAEATVPR